MRVLEVIARWLFVIALPGPLIAGSIAAVVNSPWVYEQGFTKYQVGYTTGLADAELRKTAEGLISYFNSGEEYINLTVTKDGKPFVLFNQREVLHLKDFKGLIQLDYKVLIGMLIYVLAYIGVRIWRRDRRRMAQGALRGGSLTLALMLALGIGWLLDFEQLFLQFHLLSYANDLWMLDPTKDYLIMLFPQGFFFDTVLLIGSIAAGAGAVMGGVGWYFSRKHKKQLSPAESA